MCGPSISQGNPSPVHNLSQTAPMISLPELSSSVSCVSALQAGTKLLMASRRRGFGRKKPYACTHPGCIKRYVRAGYLQKHQNHHPKSFICRYTPCNIALVSAEDRNSHEVVIHDKDKNADPFCYLCGFSRPVERNLSDHLRNSHADVDRREALAIIIDNRGLGSRGITLQNRQRMAPQPAEDLPELVCYICSFPTQDKRKMRRHVAYHHRKVAVKNTIVRVANGTSVDSTEGDENRENITLSCYICKAPTTNTPEILGYTTCTHNEAITKDVLVSTKTAIGLSEVEVRNDEAYYDTIPLICYICNFSTGGKINMRNHVRENHGGIGDQEVTGITLNGSELDGKVLMASEITMESQDVRNSPKKPGFEIWNRASCGHESLTTKEAIETSEAGIAIIPEEMVAEKKVSITEACPISDIATL